MRKLDENQSSRGRCGLGSPKRRKRPLIQIKSLAPNREALLAYKYFFCLTNAISDRLIFHLISRDHLESEEKPRVVPKTRDGRLLHMLTAWPPKSHRSQTLNRGFVRVCKKIWKSKSGLKKLSQETHQSNILPFEMLLIHPARIIWSSLSIFWNICWFGAVNCLPSWPRRGCL